MLTTPRVLALILAACSMAATVVEVEAIFPNRWPLYRSAGKNWHAGYAHYQYGQPVAMVVPPTANLQTDWGWGVGSSRVYRMDQQFGRDYVGPTGGGGYRPTPYWPQDTLQFGVYNVRAPW